ncbi:hypothetical protein BSKO_11763 [Bryopsis sp. KO-2023]|nr:hypothetical protein BSKO_11761 [Bryopsis sp. KO-2023]GMH43829.1 hypothetical protein BSKO_11763 [Bryopsis sp. KO-2023]
MPPYREAPRYLFGYPLRRVAFTLHPIIGIVESKKLESWEFTSCHVIYHDKFNFRKLNDGFDIALVQLSRSSDEVPCKVEEKDMVELEHNGRSKVGSVRTMGWGLNEKGQSAKILQQLDLDLMRPLACARKFGVDSSSMARIFRQNKSICGHKDGADTCQELNENDPPWNYTVQETPQE